MGEDNSKGKIVLTIPPQTFSDLAGNRNTKKYSSKQAFDTKKADTISPTYEVINNAKGIVNTEFSLDFLFSEEIQGFTLNDISITGGSKGELSGSGDSYSLTITPD